MPSQSLPALWDSSYNTGIDFIDEQHMYFFNVVKRLETVVNQNICREQVADIFFSLVHYVEHFRLREEIYYKDLKMKKLVEHKKSHQAFVTGIVRFKDEFTGGEEKVCNNLLAFLTEWFFAHIIGTDHEVIEELRKAGL